MRTCDAQLGPVLAAEPTASEGGSLNDVELLCFAGPRTAKGLAEAAITDLHEKFISRPATVKAFAVFLAGSDLPKVMLAAASH